MAETLMITRRELRQQASRQGVALGALEKEMFRELRALFEERLPRRL